MKYYLLSSCLLLSMLLFACKGNEPDVINGFIIPSTILAENASAAEATLTINLNGTINEPITATYEIREGSAKFDTDLKAGSGDLTFEPDNATTSLPIELIDDDALEIGEEFEIIISYAGQQWVTKVSITDNDEIEAIKKDADGFYTSATHTSMELVWSDEFDGSSLNESDWTYELGDGCDKGLCGWGNNELQNYTNDVSNLKIEDGRMTITARDDNNQYTSARIITQKKQEFQFGRIDARAKMPKGQGIWPAIWLLGTNIDEVSWPMCGEIDIMEIVGHEPDVTHGTVHFDDSGYKTSTSSYTLVGSDFSDEFHVYSIVWDRNIMTWYIDNIPFKTFRKDNIGTYPFNQPFFFILNVAVGGNWPGNPDGSTSFPQEMVVDYVRIFQ
ncbi:MAG: family 16 glycosylhydrolase [Bacteroidota bacterium]